MWWKALAAVSRGVKANQRAASGCRAIRVSWLCLCLSEGTQAESEVRVGIELIRTWCFDFDINAVGLARWAIV
jgi:hypothetical protein